jgi:hypothetical protein
MRVGVVISVAMAFGVCGLCTTTPARAASVSRDGYAPSTAIRSSTRISGSTSVPRASAACTGGDAANAPGCCARLKRSTATPCCCSHATSPANRASSGSTLGPQTPDEQHIAGSNTRMVGMTDSYPEALHQPCTRVRFRQGVTAPRFAQGMHSAAQAVWWVRALWNRRRRVGPSVRITARAPARRRRR